MTEQRICAFVAVKIFVLYLILTLAISSRQMPPTGDEPHYLMAAHSLAVDHDLSLKENYVNRDYRVFYPGMLAKRTTLSPDHDRELPAFSPGLSLFLTPFYWLAIKLFPSALVSFLRVVICAVAAIGIWQLMLLYIRMRSNAPHSVFAVILVFALASPLATYCSLFYPEILAFLFLILAVRRLDEASTRPVSSGIWLAILSPALIWLHPKYLALSFLLLLLTAFRYYRIGKNSARFWWLVPAAQIAGIACFFLFLHAEYGSWSPNRIYGGAQKETSLIGLLAGEGPQRLWVMARMMIGYWIDQRFGIIVYAPAYLAFFPAAWWVIRRYGSRMVPALGLFCIHFLLISWGAQMGGFAPPSRHFVVLIPLMLLPILLLYPEWNRLQRWLFWTLSAIGLVISGLMFLNYRSVFTNATWRNPDGYSVFWSVFGLERWIPRLTSTPPDYGVAMFWIAATICSAWILYPRITLATRQKPVENHKEQQGLTSD